MRRGVIRSGLPAYVPAFRLAAIRNPQSAIEGFTLLEMMVSLSIISIAILALLRVVVGNVNTVIDARDRTIAANLARVKLQDIELDPEQQQAEGSGGFGETYPRFSWTSKVQETQWPELKQVVVTVVWITGRKMKQLSVEGMIRVATEDPNAQSPAGTPAGTPTGAPASPGLPGGGGGR